MAAVQAIDKAHRTGTLKMVTSRHSWREQERTRNPERRSALEAARSEVSAVANDHVILAFPVVHGHGSRLVGPLVSDIVDVSLFADLTAIGLSDSDAKHLMYAVVNSCDRFVTLDPDFLDRRDALEARCPSLRIRTPSELVAELGLTAD
jgi:hypothetical protein